MTGMEKGIFQADEYQLSARKRQTQLSYERLVSFEKHSFRGMKMGGRKDCSS